MMRHAHLAASKVDDFAMLGSLVDRFNEEQAPVTVEVRFGFKRIRGVLVEVDPRHDAFDIYVPDAPEHKQERRFFFDEVDVYRTDLD